MKRFARTGLLVMLVVLLLTPGVLAAESENVVDTLKLNQVRQNGADLTMYVSMTNAEGDPCTGTYSADQFVVSVDGNTLAVDNVQTVEPTTQGIHYVLTVDTSRSVSPTMADYVRNSLIAFVDGLGPKDTVSLVTFGVNVGTKLRNCADKDEIKQAIADLVIDEHGTALYKGVSDAIELAKEGGRSAVIVITDGRDDAQGDLQKFTKESIYNQVINSQVPLYCIGLIDNEVDRDSLKEFADMTGGGQYLIKAENIGESMERISAIVRNSLALHAVLTNPDGRTGFNEASVFQVGFQADDFILSNTLEKNINWQSVPLPAALVTPEPVPKISLTLDDEEMAFTSNTLTVTGMIEVEEGSVQADELTILVNGEPWQISERMRNGNGYTFSATGTVPDGTSELRIRAEIAGENVASGYQTLKLIIPQTTPSPELSVELDNSDTGVFFEAGQYFTISGTIRTEGTVDPDDLVLYVNGASCEMSLQQMNANEYEFTSQVMLDEAPAGGLNVQVRLNGGNVSSHTQGLVLVTPTPMPDPELQLSLSEKSVQYTPGEEVTVRGYVDVLSGVVDTSDLVLYVNRIKWDMTLTEIGEGEYSFEATSSQGLSGGADVDVWVRLQSNRDVISNTEVLTVILPEATAAPTPTPRVEATVPPTAVPPTAVPTVEPVEDESGTESAEPVEPEEPVTPAPNIREDPAGWLTYMCRRLVQSGIIWYIVAGIVAVVALVVILLLVRSRSHKNKEYVSPVSVSMPPTVRGGSEGDATVEGGGTSTMGTVSSSDTPFLGEEPRRSGSRGYSGGGYSGETVSMDSSSTMHIDADDDFVGQRHGGGGTVRLSDEDEQGGTVRIDDSDENENVLPVKTIRITAVETRNHNSIGQRELCLRSGGEAVFSRKSPADELVDDAGVSAPHMKLIYDGENVFIVDLNSLNGTKVNGEAVRPQEKKQLVDGDTVKIGRTTLRFSFGGSNVY